MVPSPDRLGRSSDDAGHKSLAVASEVLAVHASTRLTLCCVLFYLGYSAVDFFIGVSTVNLAMYRGAAQLEDDPLYLPAGQMGYGWWDDAWKETKRVAKKVQSSDAVRGLEKRAVAAGAKALRGAVEGATDGLADTALTAIGAPELVPAADALIDRGAKALQRKGTEYLDQKIDASGRGVRYMAPAGWRFTPQRKRNTGWPWAPAQWRGPHARSRPLSVRARFKAQRQRHVRPRGDARSGPRQRSRRVRVGLR